MLSKEAGGSNDGAVVAGARDELNSRRQLLRSESAGHAHRRKPAQLSQTTHRIGKRQIRFEISVERPGRDRKRRRGEDVELIEERVGAFLKDETNLERAHVVGRGDLLVDNLTMGSR